MNFSTPHTRFTGNPQTYTEHFSTAFTGSLKLIALGLGGLIHAVFPEIKPLQFWTSSGVIRLYRQLEESGRHIDEISRIK